VASAKSEEKKMNRKIYAIGLMMLLMSMAMSVVVSATECMTIKEIRAEAHKQALQYADDHDLPTWKASVRRYEMRIRSVLFGERHKCMEKKCDDWVRPILESKPVLMCPNNC
jgi:hypothetical protein